jgi:hypothetical protein
MIDSIIKNLLSNKKTKKRVLYLIVENSLKLVKTHSLVKEKFIKMHKSNKMV